MATIDFATREITLHLVWFGPTQSGSGTNVRQLHRLIRAREKTELERVGGGKDRTERTWSFVCMPDHLPAIEGFDGRVQLRSVPGGDGVGLDRDAMLVGVDGIVFVADARAHRASANLDAILDLERILARLGLEPADIPLVFQVNQTDAANARPAARVLDDLDPFGMPWVEAVARQGRGVMETWDSLLSGVTSRLRDKLAGHRASLTLTALHRVDRERAEDGVRAHVEGLPRSGADRTLLATTLPAVAEFLVRPAELRGQVPVRHVRTHVVGDRLRVEAVFRKADGDLRKLALLLETGLANQPLLENSSSDRPEVSSPPVSRRRIDLDPPGELSRMTYGLAGVLGGLLCGVSLGYVLFG